MADHVKMACGWKCGTFLSRREIGKHFTECPNRPRKVAADDSTRPVEPLSDPLTPEAPADANDWKAVAPYAPDSDRVASLRALLECAESSVGLRPSTEPPAQPNPSEPSPYAKSEKRRFWVEMFAGLKKLGQYDEGGAAEEFAGLVRGLKLPAGFGRWPESKKIDWLVENAPMGEK